MKKKVRLSKSDIKIINEYSKKNINEMMLNFNQGLELEHRKPINIIESINSYNQKNDF